MGTKVTPTNCCLYTALHDSTFAALQQVHASCHSQTIRHKVALAQILLCALRLYTVSITQAMLHTPFVHPFILSFVTVPK